jgi:hypothetical protein
VNQPPISKGRGNWRRLAAKSRVRPWIRSAGPFQKITLSIERQSPPLDLIATTNTRPAAIDSSFPVEEGLDLPGAQRSLLGAGCR